MPKPIPILKEDDAPVITFCPDFENYPSGHPDNTVKNTFLTDCEYCDKQMWFSKKKQQAKNACGLLDKPFIAMCFQCGFIFAKKNPDVYNV